MQIAKQKNRIFWHTLCVLAAMLVLPAAGSAEALQLSVQAPRVVSTGEIFRLTFSANAQVEGFTAPTLQGFTVLAGPAQGSSTSVQFVNGKMTQNTTISFSYTIRAEKEGKFTIPSATVKAGNATAQSQPFEIEVVKGEAPATGAQQGASGGQRQQSATNAAGQNLYVSVAPSKREVYRGECLSATTKLYNRGNSISGVENIKAPTYTGFWTQEIAKASQLQAQRENVNGTVYDAYFLWQYLLVPQQTGDLVISPCEMDLAVQVRVRTNDPFAEFFGGGYQSVRKHLQSRPVTIHVKDLPGGAPASFAGAVGDFKIGASLSRTNLMANDATTLTIRITGTGNLMLLNAPKVSYPMDFEAYDAKTTNNFKNSANGASGTRQFEIPLIPRSAGDFTIPPIEFSYFNPASQKYITLHTEPLSLSVEKDTKSPAGGNYTVGEGRKDIKILGQDIRFINTSATLTQQGTLFFGTGIFYLCYAVLIALALAAYFWLKKHRKEAANVTLVRNKKANKVAKKRLRNSAQLLKLGNAQGFYDELLRAMWGYLSDKLSIPVADLSRDNASAAFAERGIEDTYIATFLKVIDECEFARYAPSSAGKGMKELYAEAADVIGKLEQRI